MYLDLELVAQAREALQTPTTTETVHQALSAVVRRERLRRLAARQFEDLTPEALEQLRDSRSRES